MTDSISVLDHGLVTLRNVSGPTRRRNHAFDADDVDPANSARMSFGQMDSGRTREQDLKLAEYLMKNRHSTPMEMIQVWLEFKLPIFVARQFCLAGKTELHFENGLEGEYRRKVPVEEVYRVFMTGGRQRQQLQSRKLRKLDLATGEKATTHIVDIWQTGVKPIYRVLLDSNDKDRFELWVTSDHPLYTDSGWASLQDICRLPTASDTSWECDGSFVATIGRQQSGYYTRRLPSPSSDLTAKELLDELWLPVHGYETLYEVSTCGRVRSTYNKATHKGHLKAPIIRTVGRYSRPVVGLCSPGMPQVQRTVGRTVLEAFLGPEPGLVARHLDGNPFNNRIDNLAWGTNKQNTEDSISHGTHGSTLEVVFTSIAEVEYCGLEPTYDLEVADADHNFVAGGVVVHNCRHRTQSLNEVSARYTKLPAEWYVPKLEVICGKAESNKQGRSSEQHFEAEWFQRELDSQCDSSYRLYELSLAKGIAPEIARTFLHVNHYTHWLSSMNLHNLMHFLSLRTHPHAQYEARVYAEAVLELLDGALPELMQLYRRYYV